MAVVDSAEAGRRAAARGATMIQLRAPEKSAREVERECAALVRDIDGPVLVSSRCDIALACGAAGVNLPERDVAVADARRLLGDRLIGRSVHSLEAALAAADDGADYLIFGPIWASPTHPHRRGLGIEALAAVANAVRVPVLGIGGVDSESAKECLAAGAAGYAGIRMFR
jgi:thiamine-phosphate pyrophosphorylase